MSQTVVQYKFPKPLPNKSPISHRAKKPIICTTNGFTLVEMAIVLVIVGLLLGLGASLIGPLTKRAKMTEAKEALNANVESIISWASGQKRLPNLNEFPSVIRNRYDSWSMPFYYIVDSNLIQQPSATENRICDRRSTQLSITYCKDPNCQNTDVISNIAFIVFSSGMNYNNQTHASQEITQQRTIYVYEQGQQADGYSSSTDPARPEEYDDIVKWITLDELRMKIGCQGAQIRILNNELPYGYVGTSYNAVIYADGGVLFASGGKYRWCYEGSLPAGLSASPSATSSNCLTLPETSWGQADTFVITGIPDNATGSYSLKIYARDNQDSSGSQDNIASKAFVITINPQTASANQNPSPPGAQVSFTNNINQFQTQANNPNAVTVSGNTVIFGGNAYSTTGCFWYPSTYQLTGKTMRAFFKFRFSTIDTSSNSTQYADGFTFAVTRGDMPTTACGGLGVDIGYGGLQYDSVAVEVDTYPNGGSWRYDPANNHVAVLFNGNNSHSGSNPSCPSAGCVAGSTATWLEDGVEHTTRVEIITGCNPQCNNCNNHSQNYALYKAWIDCPASACSTLTQNYTSSPTISHCFQLPSSMNTVKFGFTQGTGGAVQRVEISDFGIGFY